MNASKTIREEQSEDTRATLLKVARELFASRGYTDAAIDEIARRARVTHGALYHHFPSKLDLFAAVCEELEQELAERVSAAAQARPADAEARALEVGCGAFLDACMERDFQRIVLLDAPSVLGWEAWHEIDRRYGLALLTAGIEAEVSRGQIGGARPESLASVVHGALNEAGHAIARAPDPERTRAEMGAAIDALIAGLRRAPRPKARR